MIDDLVKFCLTEVAYEGELGCTIGRLKELITRFSDTPLASSSLTSLTNDLGEQKEKKAKQNVDDAYCAYVYSLIVKHPSIVIGIVPEGTPPVWIAPPPHKKGQTPLPPPLSLNVISGAKEKSMAELSEAHGSQLRIAADKEACFVALTGSHNRPSRLSDTVYTTLQIITRARERGIPIKDIGPITKYDPKSIFYQIAQLVDLNLVVKVSKGPSLNWAVLKKFYERSQLWQMIMGEKDKEPGGINGAEDSDTNIGDEAETAELVANVSLLRYRVLKLVERATNQIHQYNNMIVSAGFVNPTKSQRRFFTSRLNEMIKEGLLEKFGVPTDRGTAVCVKLTDSGRDVLGNRNPEPTMQPVKKAAEENVLQAEIEDGEFEWSRDIRPSRGVGLQRQIIGLLEVNPGGLSIREMSTLLGDFDRRTIEQVLTRLCTRVPPRHLADLHPVTVMETEGKMRRQRYFTVKHYRQLLEDQNLPDDRYNWLNMKNVGEYAHVDETMFWKTSADIAQHIANIQEIRFKKARESIKPSTAKKRVLKNPIINGVVKRGRPRKDQTVVAAGGGGVIMAKPARKRAPKRKATELDFVMEDGRNPMQVAEPDTTDQTIRSPIKPTKPRKRKKTDQPSAGQETTVGVATLSDIQAVPNPVISNQEVTMANAPALVPAISFSGPSEPSIELPMVPETAKAGSEKGKKRSAEEADISASKLPKKKQKIAQAPPSSEAAPSNLETPDPLPQGSQVDVTEPTQDSIPTTDSVRKSPPVESDMRLKSSTRPHRRSKQQKPRATNVSELRRQQEIMDVLLAKDGIMQLNTEMAVHLRDRVQELTESGVQTGQSAGFLSDKKTITRAVTALEEKGRVKVMKTVILDPNRKGSLQQPTTIIYHPTTSQEQIQAFLASLQKPYKPTTQIPTVPLPVTDIVGFSKSAKRIVNPHRENSGPPGMSAAAVSGPRQQFLEDRQTIAQLFGFLLGKSRRVQELYLFTLSHILSESPSPTVVSVEERIVSTNYWTEDYPLGSFCAIIPTQVYIPYLEVAQSNPDVLNQPLKSLEPSLRRALKTKHARTRIRLMEILTVLHDLQLITPLKESPDGPVSLADVREGAWPNSFSEIEMPSGSNPKPPAFWRFNKQVSLWVLGLAKYTSQSIEAEPPFYKDLEISHLDDAVSYWSLLQRVCDRQSHFASFDTSAKSSKPFPFSPAVLTSLCHYRGWTADYRLSKLQEEYLKDMVDVGELTTPLSDPTPDRLMQAAFITCAPQQVICNYFVAQATRLEGAFERIERKKKKSNSVRATHDTLHKSFTQKAQQHLQDVGDKWDRLVNELVEGRLSVENEEKLRPLRSRYIMVGGVVDEEKLKDIIENVLRNPVEAVRNRYQKTSSRFTSNLPPDIQMEDIEEAMPQLDRIFRQPQLSISTAVEPLDANGFPPLPPLISHQAARSVAEIVDGMGTAPEDEAPRPKRSKSSVKGGDTPSNGPKEVVSRRKRFHWNEEYDELLRDTIAVIRARCREKTRGIRWQPAEKVFPPVRANNLRNHFNKYIAQPGAASYMDRLERGWYNLWQTHKGRAGLPDPDPSTPEGCDLVLHVDFLRKYLDKRKLLSNLEAIEVSNASPMSQPDLPLDLKDLNNLFRVEEQGPSTLDSILQQYWGDFPAYLNERAHTISAVSFAEKHVFAPVDPPIEQSMAESTIQIIVATEQESYDDEVATALLIPFGEETIKLATHALWKRGTISKISKTKVGRGYRMSESNAEDLTGKFPARRLEDAAAIEVVFQEDPDEWRSWAIDASEGEMAALLHRASRHEVEFRMQVPDLKMARDIAQWTSRKIQDEMLETRIDVLFVQPELTTTTPSEDDLELPASEGLKDRYDGGMPKNANGTDTSGHGDAYNGKRANCLILNGAGELVNCAKCLEDVRRSVLAQNPSPGLEKNILALLDRLEKAGKQGLVAEDVWSSHELSSAMPLLVASVPPLAFWSGYTRSRLVSTKFIGHHAIWLSGEAVEGSDAGSRLVMPRRWIDLKGDIIPATWDSSLRAVVGLLLTRPLVDHTSLIQYFSKTYDRLDILTVLKHLEDKGIVRMVRGSEDDEKGAHKVDEMTLVEEARTFWELEKSFEWRMLL